MLKHKIIGRNISILYRSESNYTDKRIRNLNLSKIQVEILLFIKENPETNLKEINNYFKFNKATITKIVKHLVSEGYVEFFINSMDKREKRLIITEKSKSLLPEIKKVFDVWEEIILKDISEEDIEITRNVMAQMVKNMSLIKEENNE